MGLARIDLRSDTVTRPTDAMRDAIARAEVGDDVYGEDPSVNRLEAATAERLGTQSAMFVPSATMANQIALRVHTRHGDLVLAGEGQHLQLYESGAPAALSGVQVQSLGVGGFFDADDVRAGLPFPDIHLAPASLLVAENTHNTSGGRVFPFETLERATGAAREAGLKTHLDGARLFNAVIASGIPAARWAGLFDTVQICLSKGLGAPVGALLCGSSEALERGRRVRKMLGGGMRQAGLLAAAGLHALEHHVERLAEDHANALRLAEGFEKLGLPVDPPPETNMVMFGFPDTLGFLRATREREVWIDPTEAGRFRAVTHLDVGADDVDEAIERVGQALAELRG